MGVHEHRQASRWAFTTLTSLSRPPEKLFEASTSTLTDVLDTPPDVLDTLDGVGHTLQGVLDTVEGVLDTLVDGLSRRRTR